MNAIFWRTRRPTGKKKNPYYSMLEDEDTVGRILEEFGLPPQEGHIVNGHVPVKSKNGRIL